MTPMQHSCMLDRPVNSLVNLQNNQIHVILELGIVEMLFLSY